MLTDADCRNAKPADKPYKLPDDGGLLLFVAPTGSRTWRWRYRFGAKEKLLTIGQYPKIGLAEARRLRNQARTDLEHGTDPAEAKRLRKLAGIAEEQNSFEAVARLWHAKHEPIWSERHAYDVLTSLAPMFAAIGKKAVSDITPPMVLAALRPIEARGAVETARRIRQRASAVFVFAIASGLAEQDPAAVVKAALAPVVRGRQPAVVDLVAARAMLGAIDATPAHPVTKLALRFLALTAVRPGEVRGAKWQEFQDLQGPEPIWRIPADRMKMKREHWVPLAPEAVEVLRALKQLGIRGPLVFPSVRNWRKSMSTNAMGYLMHRAGYHGLHVPHGWRSTFSTAMNERYPEDRAVIDLMLAHVPTNNVEAAYNRALYMPRRRKLAQIWAAMLLKEAPHAVDLLDGDRRGASAA